MAWKNHIRKNHNKVDRDHDWSSSLGVQKKAQKAASNFTTEFLIFTHTGF